MQTIRSLMLAVAVGLLFSLSAATPADAGFGDDMKKKACETTCSKTEKKCVKECKDEADKDACKLVCEEADNQCVQECVDA